MITLHCTLPGPRRFTAQLDEVRRWSMFVGESAQILGAHVIDFEALSDGAELWTVFVSNAACNPDGTGFCGAVKFDSLELDIPDGWEIEHELARPCIAGPVLVKPIAGGGQHVFDAARGLVFRFGLWRGGEFNRWAVRSALDLAELKIPRIVTEYGAQRMTLPQVNRGVQAKRWGARLERQSTALRRGVADLEAYLWGPALGGLWHLPEHPTAYDYGGRRIQFVFGYGQVREEVLFERRLLDGFASRMRVWCFDKRTGARITSEDWARAAGKNYQPFQTSITSGDEEQRDQYAPNKAPQFPPALDPDRVFNAGTCPYEAHIRGYDTIDAAHLTRAMGSAQAAWWHAKDPFARFYLANLAHHVRQAWCDIGDPKADLKTSRSMISDLRIAQANPGQASPSKGRAAGWSLTALANGHAVARTKTEQAQFAGALDMALRIFRASRMPNYQTQRAKKGGDIAQVWDLKLVADNVHALQSFEQPINWHGRMCALWQLGRIPTSKPTLLGRLARRVFGNQDLELVIQAALDLYAQGVPPTKYKAVGTSTAPYAHTQPITTDHDWDNAHVANALAELDRASGHSKINALMRQAAPSDWRRILDSGDALAFPEWNVALVAQMQALE